MNDNKELIEQLKQALTLAREALSHTDTQIYHHNFEAEEKALIAIDFALEAINV
jgi:hypothetical protein